MGRRRTRLKSNLLTASLTFAIPLCVLVGLVFRDRSREIETAERERLGVAYVKQLNQLMTLFADPRSEGTQSERAAIRPEIDAAFRGLEAVDALHGERLQTTAAALALHGLEHFHVGQLLREWTEHKASGAYHVDHMLDDARSLMRHVNNSSGLSLDPELDTHYLMTLCAGELPDALTQMHYIGEFSRSSEELGRNSREQLKMFSWLLEGDLERIAYSVSVAGDPLSNVRTDPRAVSAALREPSEALRLDGRELRQAARALAETRGQSEAERVQYGDAVAGILGSIGALSDRSSRELDRLLAARISSQESARMAALALMLASVVVSSWLLRRAFRDVRHQLDDAGRVARAIGAGNLAVAIDPDAAGETRQLMTHLEAMAVELSGIMQQAASLAERVASTTHEMERRSLEIDAHFTRQDEAVAQSSDAVKRVAENATRIAALTGRLSESTTLSSDVATALAAGATQMSESAESLFGSVSEVSLAIQEQADGLARVLGSAETVHEAAEHTSGYMAQLQERVANTERAAKGSSELSQRSTLVATSGQASVARTLAGMNEIEATSRELEASLERLADRSRAIGQVTDMIDLVADDTSLLAFNAAVIAAQSGGQSRAFGVVASEIKALSKRVFERTREIDGLVRSLQVESNAAQRVLARSMESIQQGMELSADTRKTFETIAGAARESSAQAGMIAAAVEEQRDVVSAVARQMESVHGGVATIRSATSGQHGSNQMLLRNAQQVHDVSGQLQATAQEQAKGASDVQRSVDRIRSAVASIDASVYEQTQGCARARGCIEATADSARATRFDVAAMNETVQALLRESDQLRAHIQRFTLRV